MYIQMKLRKTKHGKTRRPYVRINSVCGCDCECDSVVHAERAP